MINFHKQVVLNLKKMDWSRHSVQTLMRIHLHIRICLLIPMHRTQFQTSEKKELCMSLFSSPHCQTGKSNSLSILHLNSITSHFMILECIVEKHCCSRSLHYNQKSSSIYCPEGSPNIYERSTSYNLMYNHI